MAGVLLNDRSAAARLRGYVVALLMVAASTLFGLSIVARWGSAAVDMLYLPAVLAAAALSGLGPALLAAFASALAYNYFFTTPRLTFQIDNPNDIVTVTVLFAVAVVTSHLAASIRRQARVAQAHAARNATSAGLARELLSCTTQADIAAVSTRGLAEVFECNSALFDATAQPRLIASSPVAMQMTPSDLAVAALVIATGESAGRGVSRAVPTEWQFHAVKSGDSVIGAIGLARDDGAPPVRPDQLPLLDNLLDQVALALERARLEGEARQFESERERDQVRSALLASIGHELRPPLKAIKTALGGLRRAGSDKELLSELGSETLRIERFVSNLLDLETASDRQPVEAGAVTIDLYRRVVSKDGADVHLTPKEFSVLAELAKHPGRVLTHAHLLRAAWGPAQEGQTEYLRVAVRALRQKLERDPSRPALIINEPAVGYRLLV
jgi:two-component system sensor histidine kinase KdpD